MTENNNETNLLVEGLKVAAEFLILPGTSLLAQSDYKRGFIHAGVGIAARVALKPPAVALTAVALTAANSYCTAKTGEGLLSKLMSFNPVDAKNAVFGNKDARDEGLRRKVYEDAAQGVSLDTIKESVAEDIEDLYHEATAKAKADAEDKTTSEVPNKASNDEVNNVEASNNADTDSTGTTGKNKKA